MKHLFLSLFSLAILPALTELPQPSCVPFRCLVKIAPGSEEAVHNALVNLVYVDEVRPMFPNLIPDDAKQACSHCDPFSGVLNYCIVEGVEGGLSSEEMVEAVQKIDGVLWAGLDHTIKPGALALINDEDDSIPKDWHLDAMGVPRNSVVDDCMVIAVIDTGMDLNHQGLQSSLWTNSGESSGSNADQNGYLGDLHGWDFVNDALESGVREPDSLVFLNDDNGHGTHCGGIIGGEDASGSPIGAAHGLPLMALKALDGGTGCISDVAEAVVYAVRNGARVISMSLAFPHDNQAFREILEAASQCAVLVAAAGNECLPKDLYPRYPAAYNSVVGVEAASCEVDVNGNLVRAPFSNYGYDVLAPGRWMYSTLPDQKYGRLSGTSMATPLVAGIAARYWAQNPNATPGEVHNLLRTHGARFGDMQLGALPASTLEFENFEITDSPVMPYALRNQSVTVQFNLRNRGAHTSGLFELQRIDANGSPIGPSLGSQTYFAAAGEQASATFTLMVPNNAPWLLRLSDQTGTFEQDIQVPITRRPELFYVLGYYYMVLGPNFHYLIDQPIYIPSNGSMWILQGTQVTIATDKPIVIEGRLLARGTASQPILIDVEPGCHWGGFNLHNAPMPTFRPREYASGSIMTHTYMRAETNPTKPRHSKAIDGANIYLAHNRFEGFSTAIVYGHGTVIENNLFYYNDFGITHYIPGWRPEKAPGRRCLLGQPCYDDNYVRHNTFDKSTQASISVLWVENPTDTVITANNFIKDPDLFPCMTPTEIISDEPVPLDGNYWGNNSGDISEKISNGIVPTSIRANPVSQAPPIVSKIEISPPNPHCPMRLPGPQPVCCTVDSEGVPDCDAQFCPSPLMENLPTDGFLLPVVRNEGTVIFDVHFSRDMSMAQEPELTLSLEPTVVIKKANDKDHPPAPLMGWISANHWRTAVRVDDSMASGIYTINVTGAKSIDGIPLPPLDCRFRFENGNTSGGTEGAVGGGGKTCTTDDVNENTCYRIGDASFTALAYNFLSRTPTTDFVKLNPTPLRKEPYGNYSFTDAPPPPGSHYHYAFEPLKSDLTPAARTEEICVITPDEGPATKGQMEEAP